jgi:hypothetical protein
MAPVFGSRANFVSRLTLLLTGLLFMSGFAYLALGAWSGYATGVGYAPQQPIPFSHAHHTALGIDCAYCHQEAAVSATAGMPSVATCMTCHAEIWTDAPMLAPLREAWRTDERIAWRRVYDLPDHVYFDHSVHVAAGVGCIECHGDMGAQPLTYKTVSLHMRWCLDCHRHPPVGQDRPPYGGAADGGAADDEGVAGLVNSLMSCSACHR